MTDSEVRQKFEEWQQTLMMRSDVPTLLQAFSAGMRAGEITRWIPVEEKLPEVGVTVLAITTPGRYVHVLKLDQSQEWRNSFDRNHPEKYYWLELNAVTHWQPLPAAPEEKKSAISGAEESKK